jgi:putative nucleotidyltransferase with HDIG domain
VEDEPAIAIAVLRLPSARGAESVPEALVSAAPAAVAEVASAAPTLDVLAEEGSWDAAGGRFRKHAISVRDVAGRLAVELSLDVGRLRALGLVHDVGRPALHSSRVAPEAPGTPEQRLAAERRDGGRDHAEAGAELLRRWGLSGDLVDGVLNHHQATEGESAALRLADALAHFGQLQPIDIPTVVALSDGLGLPRETLTDLMVELPGVFLAGHRASPNPLSPRELEVVRLLADGLTSQQVADRLGITSSTVNNHLHRIYRRLDVADRSQLVLRAREERWM